MAQEIERKFLINPQIWHPTQEGLLIRQGYLSREKERTVRVRIKGGKGYLTVKGVTEGISRQEYEYEIPVTEAAAMLDSLCYQPLIEKKRYLEKYGQQVWEIDVFSGANQGLIVAEAELKSANQLLDLPPWITQEVSHDSRYFNSNLLLHPYKDWVKE